MARYRVNLNNDIHLPTPFDILYGGRRETVKDPALLRLTPDKSPRPLLGNNRMRLYVDGVLKYEGRVLGGAQFGELRRTSSGKTEVWLDPRYVTPMSILEETREAKVWGVPIEFE